jgi:3-oxoacyl-[acyl-carrier protein] reductase
LSRSVLVTGGNRGIGLAIARAFADQGDAVAVTYRTGEPPVVQPAEGGSFLAVQCDITRSEDVDRAFAEIEAAHGPVEILVANAGITRDTLVLRMSDEDFEAVIDTNLKGSFRVAKRAARGMLRLRRGRLIFISSVVGLTGSAGQVNYAASKAGLVGLARSLARELGSRSITANVIAPGFVDTDMTAVLDEGRKKEIVAQVPLGRYAAPAEIAGVTVFLASPEAAYITGAVIPVDGGLGMGH